MAIKLQVSYKSPSCTSTDATVSGYRQDGSKFEEAGGIIVARAADPRIALPHAHINARVCPTEDALPLLRIHSDHTPLRGE